MLGSKSRVQEYGSSIPTRSFSRIEQRHIWRKWRAGESVLSRLKYSTLPDLFEACIDRNLGRKTNQNMWKSIVVDDATSDGKKTMLSENIVTLYQTAI